MTNDEKSALLGYLEFNLVSMVEQLEKKLCMHLDTTAVGFLYDGAYEVLNEMERTLTDQREDIPQKVFFYKPKS